MLPPSYLDLLRDSFLNRNSDSASPKPTLATVGGRDRQARGVESWTVECVKCGGGGGTKVSVCGNIWLWERQGEGRGTLRSGDETDWRDRTMQRGD